MNDFELQISPVSDYKAPIMPKYGEDKPAMLKKLPSRWQKSAKFVAGLSLAGLLALSGCGRDDYTEPQQRTTDQGLRYVLNYRQGNFDKYGNYGGYSESELLVRLSGGGAGISFYVVCLTEQEAFGMIRARLEAAGLVFSQNVPHYTAYFPNEYSRMHGIPENLSYGLDLFDEQKDVGLVFIDTWGSMVAGEVSRIFEESEYNITAGIFYNPSQRVDAGYLYGMPITPSLAMAEAERHTLDSQIINLADMFIARLQLEGILEPFSNVDIIIDGVPFDFGELPIIVNNHMMVPAVVNNHMTVPATPFFDALGLAISHEADRQPERGRFVAENGDYRIRFSYRMWNDSVSVFLVTINGNFITPGVPMFVLNDTWFVPLRYVAEALGSSVEWDEETRTFTVTTN